MTDPLEVSSKDFQRQPGRYQRLAQAQPLTITQHGEPSLVVLSVAEYRRLKARDRQVLAIDELTKDEADDLLAALRESRRLGKPKNRRVSRRSRPG